MGWLSLGLFLGPHRLTEGSWPMCPLSGAMSRCRTASPGEDLYLKPEWREGPRSMVSQRGTGGWGDWDSRSLQSFQAEFQPRVTGERCQSGWARGSEHPGIWRKPCPEKKQMCFTHTACSGRAASVCTRGSQALQSTWPWPNCLTSP